MHSCNGVSTDLITLIEKEVADREFITLGELRDKAKRKAKKAEKAEKAEKAAKHSGRASEVQGLIDKLYGVDNRHAGVLLEFDSVAEAIYELKPLDDMDEGEMCDRLNEGLASLGFGSFF